MFQLYYKHFICVFKNKKFKPFYINILTFLLPKGKLSCFPIFNCNCISIYISFISSEDILKFKDMHWIISLNIDHRFNSERRDRDRMIANHPYNQCLWPLLIMWVRTPLRRGLFDTTICHKACQWLATGRWFSPSSPVSSTNKTYCHDMYTP